MTQYKLVIFDFDGTLANSFPWFLGMVNSLAHRYRFQPLDMDRLDEYRGYSGREMMAHLKISWWKVPFLANETRRRMKQQVQQIKPFDGAEKLLQDIHAAGIKIAIVTSNSRENVEAVLSDETLALISSFSCGAGIYGKQRKFRNVLKKHRLSPADVLSVGDEIRDAEASSACGIDFLGVAWGFTKADQLQKHTTLKVCAHFDEILAVVSAADCCNPP